MFVLIGKIKSEAFEPFYFYPDISNQKTYQISCRKSRRNDRSKVDP